MSGEGPFRGGLEVGPCPRCHVVMDNAGDHLVCLAGCGEWYPRMTIEPRVNWLAVVAARVSQAVGGWPWAAAICPICQREMAIGFREELRFDHCDRDGIWLDTGEYERFAQVFRLP